jgi:hypothetical protein
LKQKAPELAGFGKGQNASFEFFHFGRSPVAFLVRELLPYFDRKLEILGRALRPGFGGFWNAWPVESGIDFDRVEVS